MWNLEKRIKETVKLISGKRVKKIYKDLKSIPKNIDILGLTIRIFNYPISFVFLEGVYKFNDDIKFYESEVSRRLEISYNKETIIEKRKLLKSINNQTYLKTISFLPEDIKI